MDFEMNSPGGVFLLIATFFGLLFLVISLITSLDNKKKIEKSERRERLIKEWNQKEKSNQPCASVSNSASSPLVAAKSFNSDKGLSSQSSGLSVTDVVVIGAIAHSLQSSGAQECDISSSRTSYSDSCSYGYDGGSSDSGGSGSFDD